jgi:hypothetical protein
MGLPWDTRVGLFVVHHFSVPPWLILMSMNRSPKGLWRPAVRHSPASFAADYCWENPGIRTAGSIRGASNQ